MTKPDNLEYAFYGQVYGGNQSVVAYRIVGASWTGDTYWAEQDASLLPGFDYHNTLGDGDGSVGQYIVFVARPGDQSPNFSGQTYTQVWGFDPFDPANHVPTSVRYWELQPGSDVMATTLGVLPKVGTSGNYDYYAGLVTISVDASPNPAYGSDNSGWTPVSTSTPLSVDGLNSASGDSGPQAPGDTPPAGAYVAWYFTPKGSPPPYKFPTGWTPGNTTGSGPVLPNIGSPDGQPWHWFAGLVNVAPGSPDPSVEWNPVSVNTSLTANAVDTAQFVQAPVVLATYYSEDGTPPTTLPEGWTFRPYGLGPVAITDENVGGVIGDIAYVVSGYVYNSKQIGRADPRYIGEFPARIEVGDVFDVAGDVYVATHAGTLDGTVSTDGATFRIYRQNYWPFLERYNLKTKTWLPRIKLPTTRKLTFQNLDPVWNPGQGMWVAAAGPYHLPAGSLPYPGHPSDIDDAFYAVVSATSVSADFSGYLGDVIASAVNDSQGSVAYSEGDYFVLSLRGDGVEGSGPPTIFSPQVLGDSLGTRLATLDFPSYASEGGFGGIINGKLYFGGGDGANITGNEFFVFDPATNVFTKLPDVEGSFTPDYVAYGVLNGKLWVLGRDVPNVDYWMYDPTVAAWSYGNFVGDICADQVQGVEIDGKLYFVYDRVYVFDPVALTVTAKTSQPGSGTDDPGYCWEQAGVLHVLLRSNSKFSQYRYDVAGDVWIQDDVLVPYTSDYQVGVVHREAPYVLSGITSDSGNNVAGVYGLTGNLPIEVLPVVPTTTDPYNHRNPKAEEHRFTGLYPDNTYPLVDGHLDIEQEKRLQARQESDWARGARLTHPPFTSKGPGVV